MNKFEKASKDIERIIIDLCSYKTTDDFIAASIESTCEQLSCINKDIKGIAAVIKETEKKEDERIEKMIQEVVKNAKFVNDRGQILSNAEVISYLMSGTMPGGGVARIVVDKDAYKSFMRSAR